MDAKNKASDDRLYVGFVSGKLDMEGRARAYKALLKEYKDRPSLQNLIKAHILGSKQPP